jgi:hypothetical protein
MENNNLPTLEETVKTIELEPGESLRIKIIGVKETKYKVILTPEAISKIYLWIGEDFLESHLNYMAGAVCFFTDKAIEEKIEDQYDHFANIQAITTIHQDLIKFLR